MATNLFRSVLKNQIEKYYSVKKGSQVDKIPNDKFYFVLGKPRKADEDNLFSNMLEIDYHDADFWVNHNAWNYTPAITYSRSDAGGYEVWKTLELTKFCDFLDDIYNGGYDMKRLGCNLHQLCIKSDVVVDPFGVGVYLCIEFTFRIKKYEMDDIYAMILRINIFNLFDEECKTVMKDFIVFEDGNTPDSFEEWVRVKVDLSNVKPENKESIKRTIRMNTLLFQPPNDILPSDLNKNGICGFSFLAGKVESDIRTILYRSLMNMLDDPEITDKLSEYVLAYSQANSRSH